MKKSRYAKLFLLALTVPLAACGPERSAEDLAVLEPEEATEANKPEALEVWVHDTEQYLAAYREIASAFTEETGIEVKIVPFGLWDQLDAMSLDAPSGRGPDLFFQPNDMTGNVYLQGLAAELTLTEEQKEGYMDGALEALSYEGAQIGIPASVETYALMYNEDLVPEPPNTVEELETTMEELTNPAKDEYGFLLEGQEMYFAYPFFEAYDGYIFKQEGNSFNLDDIGVANKGSVKGAELLQSWYEKGYLPQNLNGDILNGLFMEGKVGAVFSGPWNISEYEKALGDRLKTAPLPKANGEVLTSYAGIKGWMVNQYSDHINWAKELALFMTNGENGKIFFEHAKEIPARTDVELNDELYQGFVDQLEHSEFMPNMPAISAAWDPLRDALIFITRGEDAKEVLEEAEDMIIDEIEIMGARD
ncbi:extracellular solute-binding protein [Shouchella clausii]|uniref:extracellular solute-binding protein n=1 Tax=Shouchella clausii TaxID=79880 RepID=UPI000BA56935|nr:extracellular solute-binding protein [Shouchella clausii]PAD93316.1 ABC transporter substrate-binding protein [Shouchella clausii]